MVAILAEILLHFYTSTVVPQCVASAHDLALTRSPFAPTEVTELGAADTGDVVATAPFFYNMAALEALHEMHFPTKAGNLVGRLGSEKLVLRTAHACMPLRPALEAERLLALWATVRTFHICACLEDLVEGD